MDFAGVSLSETDADIHLFNENFIDHDNNTNCRYYNSDQFNNTFGSANCNKTLSVIHLNIRSIVANGDYFLAYLQTLSLKFNVICLTETWTSSSEPPINYFPNYVGYHSVRSNRKGGGVSIFVHSKLSSREVGVGTCNLDFFESQSVEVSYGSKSCIIAAGYRPPGRERCDLFLNYFSSNIHTLQNLNENLIICGDYNLDFLQISNDAKIAEFYDSLNSIFMLPTITGPTRITENTATLIDNIFVSKPFNYSSGIITLDLSDHYPIFLVYHEYFDGLDKCNKIKYRNINEESLLRLSNVFSNLSFDHIYNSDDCNYCLNLLDDAIMREFDRCCPIISKTISARDREKPWINSEVKSYKREREKSTVVS